jgi:hypothetical protein
MTPLFDQMRLFESIFLVFKLVETFVNVLLVSVFALSVDSGRKCHFLLVLI